MKRLDKDALGAISQDVSDVIRSASWGQLDWAEVCRSVTRLFPGSYCAILNQSLDRPEFGFHVYDGIEDTHIQSFFDYYAFINPWENFWRNARNGGIIVAERDQPAAMFSDTEFYADWMRSVGRYDAAVGMRLGLDRRELIYMPIHYDTRYADRYDRELEFLMTSLRPVLQDALSMKVQLRGLGEAQNAVAALLNREHELAFVIDQDCRLVEANAAAIEAFEKGSMLRNRRSRVNFGNDLADKQLLAACHLLARSRNARSQRFAAVLDDRHAVVRVSRLPDVAVGGLLLGRPQFLVQISAASVSLGPNEDLLKAAFGLTPKEVELCRYLATGATLRQACESAAISYENGRQKLKVIFLKTEVHSQAQLRALLCKF